MDKRIKNNVASDEKASKTRRELLLGGVSLAASPFLAACGDGITDANGIVKADASIVGDNPTTASVSIDGQPDSPNSEATKSFEQLSSETTPYTQVVPGAGGVFQVEVVFNTLKAAEIFLSNNAGTHIKIAAKKVTAHKSHVVHFALWNIDATAIKTSQIAISTNLKESTTPTYVTSAIQSSPNFFRDVCWARRTYDDSHDGQLEYEWVFYDGTPTETLCYVRFYRFLSFTTPAGVTLVRNNVGHNHLSNQTVTTPRHLGGLIDPKSVTFKAVRGDATTGAAPRADTVVAPNRRDPDHSELLGTLDSAESAFEKQVLERTYQRRMTQSANDLRKSRTAPITEVNDPDAYANLSNHFLTAIGGHKLTDALTSARVELTKYINTAFDSTAKALWELADENIPDVYYADETARKLLTISDVNKMPGTGVITGAVTIQAQIAGTLWDLGYLRGAGVRAIFHLANINRYGSNLASQSNYLAGVNPGYLVTFSFILKGPEVGYSGVIGKISTDLHVTVTLRLSDRGSRIRIENFTIDLKTEAEISNWMRRCFNSCVSWFKAPTRYTMLEDAPLPIGTLVLQPIPGIDMSARAQDVLDLTQHGDLDTYWDPLASPTTLRDSVRRMASQQKQGLAESTLRNWNYFEVSLLKFVFPNGEVEGDPTNTKTPYSANFNFVGVVWAPGFRMNNGGGYEYKYKSVTSAQLQAYIRVLLTADVTALVSINPSAIKSVLHNWEA